MIDNLVLVGYFFAKMAAPTQVETAIQVEISLRYGKVRRRELSTVNCEKFKKFLSRVKRVMSIYLALTSLGDGHCSHISASLCEH